MEFHDSAIPTLAMTNICPFHLMVVMPSLHFYDMLFVFFACSISLARSSLNKDYRDHAEQQHIAAQQKTALQVSCTGQS